MHIQGIPQATGEAASLLAIAQFEKPEEKRRTESAKRRMQAQSATDGSLTSSDGNLPEEEVTVSLHSQKNKEDESLTLYYY